MADWYRQVTARNSTALATVGRKIKSCACDLIGYLPASGSPALGSFYRKPKPRQPNLPPPNVGALAAMRAAISRQTVPTTGPFRPENAPPSALAKARTERVERRTCESGDLQNPRSPADCPDIHLSY